MARETVFAEDTIKMMQIIFEFNSQEDRDAVKNYMMRKLTKVGRKNKCKNDVFKLKGTFSTSLSEAQCERTILSFNDVDIPDINVFKKQVRLIGVNSNININNGLNIVIKMHEEDMRTIERCFMLMMRDYGRKFTHLFQEITTYNPAGIGDKNFLSAFEFLYL